MSATADLEVHLAINFAIEADSYFGQWWTFILNSSSNLQMHFHSTHFKSSSVSADLAARDFAILADFGLAATCFGCSFAIVPSAGYY